jgi:formylglycine-generating enzyme required for sulfatase activity
MDFIWVSMRLRKAQYETVMTGNSEGLNAKPSNWPNNNDRPVEKVSWNDVQVFLSRLNSMEQTAGRLPTGWKYVLPTEAQWEYACRAGTTTIFSWGNSATSTQANFKGTHPYGGGASGPNLQQTPMWVSIRPTPGAFSTCMAMSGNGSATGRRTTREVLRLTPRVRHRARIGSDGVVPGTRRDGPAFS